MPADSKKAKGKARRVYRFLRPEDVRFGVIVRLLDSETDEEVAYMLIGEDEADASKGQISITSPIARALLGKRVGDEVTVSVPKGKREFEILEIRVS